MTAKRIVQSSLVIAILALSFSVTSPAAAWSACASQVTVQWGDTLNSIASACGTSVAAIQSANPGLGWWLYAGQVLYMPMSGSNSNNQYYPQQMGGSGTYVVQWGDTMSDIASRYGVTLNNLLAVNPQIWNASLIFPGQVINLPGYNNYQSGSYYPNPYYNPNYYQPTPYYNPYPTPTYYPPVPSSLYSNLKVTFGHGLIVRSGPGINFAEIKSPFVSAVKNSTWQYRKSSLTIDPTQFAWVEVNLSPMVSGYATGWILVRDSLGNYFTDPKIGPFIDPNDP